MDIDLPEEIPGDPGLQETLHNPDLEVDNEVEDTLANGLKRSCSAPLINQLIAAEVAAESAAVRLGGSIRHRPVATAASYLPGSSRWRRWSTSVSPVSPVGFGGVVGGGSGSGQTGWARLNRLKVEETGDLGKSEIATEREVQREIHLEKTLSQSCEDLSLSENKETRGRKRHVGGGSNTTDPMLPLTIGVGPFPSPRTSPSPSPSPTRSTGTGKQCYSPSMQMPVPTNLSFTPSPSSSPTRRSWASRRSLSPITLRSSQLGPVKRKCMLDDGESTPSKRHSSNLLITHHQTRAAPYKVPYPSNHSWSTTPQPSPRPSSDTSRENSPVPGSSGSLGVVPGKVATAGHQTPVVEAMETRETQV